MAKERGRILSRGERGAALLIVLTALATLLPIVLSLSELVLMRQRQGAALQSHVGGQAAVRGALDVALGRLAARQIVLEPGQEHDFVLDPPHTRPVSVHVVREGDAVVLASGEVLRPEEVDEAEEGGSHASGGGLPASEYRRMEVYLVEAERPGRYPYVGVRLLAAVVRFDAQGYVLAGVRYDRSFGR